ncbi:MULTISPECIES: hypothetical protein [Streptomyces]
MFFLFLGFSTLFLLVASHPQVRPAFRTIAFVLAGVAAYLAFARRR